MFVFPMVWLGAVWRTKEALTNYLIDRRNILRANLMIDQQRLRELRELNSGANGTLTRLRAINKQGLTNGIKSLIDDYRRNNGEITNNTIIGIIDTFSAMNPIIKIFANPLKVSLINLKGRIDDRNAILNALLQSMNPAIDKYQKDVEYYEKKIEEQRQKVIEASNELAQTESLLQALGSEADNPDNPTPNDPNNPTPNDPNNPTPNDPNNPTPNDPNKPTPNDPDNPPPHAPPLPPPPPRRDPLVLDLNQDGDISTVSLADSTAFFDITGDGIKEKVGWIQTSEGKLLTGGTKVINNFYLKSKRKAA